MEETLRRLIGGPHPDAVAGFLTDETATTIHEHVAAKRKRDVEHRKDLVDRFDDS